MVLTKITLHFACEIIALSALRLYEIEDEDIPGLVAGGRYQRGYRIRGESYQEGVGAGRASRSGWNPPTLTIETHGPRGSSGS